MALDERNCWLDNCCTVELFPPNLPVRELGKSSSFWRIFDSIFQLRELQYNREFHFGLFTYHFNWANGFDENKNSEALPFS